MVPALARVKGGEMTEAFGEKKKELNGSSLWNSAQLSSFFFSPNASVISPPFTPANAGTIGTTLSYRREAFSALLNLSRSRSFILALCNCDLLLPMEQPIISAISLCS